MNVMLLPWATALALCGVLASGCSADEIGRSTTRGSPATRTPAAPSYSGAMNADLQSIIDAAAKDAARRTGRDASAIEVISSEAVTWSDGSLGCPEPGIVYTQALVPGYRIRIRAGAEVLDYHASRRGYLLLCPKGRSVEPVPGSSR